MTGMFNQRLLRRALVVIALAGLVFGLLAPVTGYATWSQWIWSAGTVPVVFWLLISIVGDLAAGRVGVDAVALVSMTAALILGQPLAGIVVAVMYAGGNLLEDFAVGRAERNLRSLVDRAPRIGHRRIGASLEDIPIERVAPGDIILVHAGEVIPVDGVVMSATATLDEAALTGEPIPVHRDKGASVHSGTINAGESFELRASVTAGESTYAGIVRMVTDAQTAKAPFIRIADRYALILLPMTLLLAGGAWYISGDPIRGLAVLVVSTPCPLILAAPVAFIAGVSRAARRGILMKGGGPLEALAQARTVMFDKTGTLTVGGARLVAIEVAPGESATDVLRFCASLEQASHHVVAAAIVFAAAARGLSIAPPEHVKETAGAGLQGVVEGRLVRAGSHQLICGSSELEPWALRALRRASWRSALSVFVSVDGRIVGAIILADELRHETPRTVQGLRAAGIMRIVMVTGDRIDAAETIGAALDLDAVLAERGPSDKVDAVAFEQSHRPTIMVGDGINDAPALAAASVGIAMGARGATASSEAADVVILVDQLDRVSEAVAIARRTRSIAVQSIVAGMTLSAIAMIVAAIGWLTPVAGAVTQEVIDVAVILNALRALSPAWKLGRRTMEPVTQQALQEGHHELDATLDRLREIADALDDATAASALPLIGEASMLVSQHVVVHERKDESSVYPRLATLLRDRTVLTAMSRAHREILHLARLLARLADGLRLQDADRYLIRDAQRVIESLESLARIHSAQEDDIYEHAMTSRS